jgi:hypothetical protein
LPHEDVPEAMKDYMPSEGNIRDITQSRDELSAYGNGAINYISSRRQFDVIE